MKLDITALITRQGFDPWELSNSRANLGQDAHRCWRNSVAQAQIPPPLLDSEEAKQEFRDWVESSGGWSLDEIAAWSDVELNALLIQWIAGDIREAFGDDLPYDPSEWDRTQYETDASAGRISSNLFFANGKVYFTISN